ncbi:hypothetical protein CRENBAI_013560 [Crenichthys baileyi]|uniref:Uncharacterized protein n=1 Tax=Crenichthys baileyi TaxID=28760 RepID=A0AAV9RLH9_9TELE
MTERSSLEDQARRMLKGFKTEEGLLLRYSHLLTSRSSPWQRLEVANHLIMDWLGVCGSFFLQSPLTLETVEGERQRAVAEIGSLFRLIPGGPDSVGRLPPLLTPIPVPLAEELEEELPPLPVPVAEGFEDEPPPLPVPVPEELKDEQPPLPDPVPEVLEDKLPPSLDPQRSPLEIYRALLCSGFRKLKEARSLTSTVKYSKPNVDLDKDHGLRKSRTGSLGRIHSGREEHKNSGFLLLKSCSLISPDEDQLFGCACLSHDAGRGDQLQALDDEYQQGHEESAAQTSNSHNNRYLSRKKKAAAPRCPNLAEVSGEVQKAAWQMMSSGTPVIAVLEVDRPVGWPVEWHLTPTGRGFCRQHCSLTNRACNSSTRLSEPIAKRKAVFSERGLKRGALQD